MNQSFKLRSLLRSLISSPPPPTLTSLKWVSTKTSPTPLLQSQQYLLHHIQHLLSLKAHQKNFNYERSLLSALKSCETTHLAVSQGRGQQIHCLVFKAGLDSNTFIRNSLINMYSKCGFFGLAKSLFDSSPKMDPVSCNIMISGYVKSGNLDDAPIEVYKEMRNASVVPNELTMASVISACCRVGRIWDCRMLHGLAKRELLFDAMEKKNVVSWNVMLNGYSKAGFANLAKELFEMIPDKDIVSWGTIIDGYVRVERLREALMMYRLMVSTGLGPSDVMMIDLISACGRAMAIAEGQQLHCVVVKTSFDFYDSVQATVIHFYSACGRINEASLQLEFGINDHVASQNALVAGFIRNRKIDRARELFNEMPERDVFSWSTMISGYTQSDQPSIALELFHRMVTCGIRPNEVTMVSVFSAIAALGTLKEGRWAHEYVHFNSIPLNDNLSASIINMYAKCGSINTALEVFYQIRDKASTVSPWNTIICGLATHGHAELSLEIYSDLQRRHIKLNAITFIGVLSACCHAGLVGLGKSYFTSMKSKHNIDPDIRHYGCMVDLLGKAGRLEEAEELIRSMPMKADVVIWGMLLSACKTHRDIIMGERAAENLAKLEPSHGPSRVLLSSLYADVGRWEDAFLVRRVMQSHRMHRLPGYSGVV
ncbi:PENTATRICOPEPTIDE REPEAT-CONTAINING PROTEIN [Salix viminalis]|uniref:PENTATRICOPEPTIDE REPEAT-CONTAINING PROTEIN n=1 Tax=Salix viminalis TaxID=40686 RepID=A0A9Q0Z5M7_SALVM|nr:PENTATRICOPEPTIDE REPEAT-CONTAINING PROTEIN [Salix viminalis]